VAPTIGGIGVDDVVGGVLRVGKCFDHDARYRASDFFRPRRIDVGSKQQNLETH
jgi:hypothetical protein